MPGPTGPIGPVLNVAVGVEEDMVAVTLIAATSAGLPLVNVTRPILKKQVPEPTPFVPPS